MKKTVFENNNNPQLCGIVQPLLRWYAENARVLPWRENTDPYRVWVSEIMLQQTQVETVTPYFDRFMRQFPDIQSLAHAEEEALLKVWEGLGYYTRARNLQKAARIIVQKYAGRFPFSYDEIRALPGIGAYTAGAVASICFGQPTPAVDGNVVRVVARLTGYDGDTAHPKVKEQIAAALRGVYPASQSADFTQSLMELGATVCLPRGAPKCESCPVNSLCMAYQTGTQMAIPVKVSKKPRKKEQKTVLLLCCGDKIALRRREAGGLLGGLWEFPNSDGSLTVQEVRRILDWWHISVVSVAESVRKKHIFTHIEWDMSSYIIICENMPQDFLWVTRETLEKQIALPSAFQAFRRVFFCTLAD